jgi:hypothetical protein
MTWGNKVGYLASEYEIFFFVEVVTLIRIAETENPELRCCSA